MDSITVHWGLSQRNVPIIGEADHRLMSGFQIWECVNLNYDLDVGCWVDGGIKKSAGTNAGGYQYYFPNLWPNGSLVEVFLQNNP